MRKVEGRGHFIPLNDLSENIRCIMVVPLVVRDKLIGAMRLMNSQVNGYDAHDATLALAFANQAAMLIESTRAHQEDIKAAALRERTRIARELHDSVSQALFGIVLGVRTSLHHHQSQKDPSMALNYALTLSEAALAEIRALIFELRPEYLEKEGLIAASEYLRFSANHANSREFISADSRDSRKNLR